MDNCIVVVPCYNEAARLDTHAFRQFAAQGHPQRFLFVDDGSTDDTSEVLETLRRYSPQRFDVCRLPHNMGKAEAVRQGMLRALRSRVDSVGFWDADLATPLEAIPQFCRILRRNPRMQMVIGVRLKLLGRSIERRIVRHCLGRIFARAASLVLGLPVCDTQCGAKLFRASPEVHALFQQPFYTNWVFDVELLARLIHGRKAGRKSAGAPPPLDDSKETVENCIYELPLDRWRDVAGSKVRARDFFKSFFELAHIYWSYLRPGVAPTPAPVPSADDAQRADDSSRGRRAA